jgi:hypothetical protein
VAVELACAAAALVLGAASTRGLGPSGPASPVARPWSGLGRPPGVAGNRLGVDASAGNGAGDGMTEGATGGPGGEPHAIAAPPGGEMYRQRGVALGMFAEDVSFSYAPLLKEIAGLGATHVALVVPIYQTNGRTSDLALHTRYSPTLGLLADTVRVARRERLEVTVFPIVRLDDPGPGEWRGNLAPHDVRAWFVRYGELLGDLAAVAAQTGATRLAIGSELSSLDGKLDAWRPLVERVRAIYPGRLIYSANWDHFKDVALYDLVDEDGLVAYFPLRSSTRAPLDDAALVTAWRGVQANIFEWHRARLQQARSQQTSAIDRPHPLVLTEVGYRSRAGATAEPWDESPGGTVDLDEQRRAFAAFRKVWSGAPQLDGVYVWNWYGYGGPTSTSYTPRGKPAAAEIRQLLQDL